MKKKLNKHFSQRRIQGYAAFVCFSLLIYAGYLQTVRGLIPCPLCIIQRIILLSLGILFLVGSLYTAIKVRWRRLHHMLIFLVSGVGGGVAWRQLWLIKHPHPAHIVAPCPADLGTLLSNLPLQKVLHLLLSGTAECSQPRPPILGISIPAWTMIFFGIFAVIGLVLAARD